ncbi:MAG: hypothetical protein ACOH1T_08635 [Microbacteriaceae bacterium]
MRTIPAVSVAASALLVLSLSGCFANPLEGIVEGVIEKQTGIDVGTGSGGSSASLPDGWPGLPVPDGEIQSSIAADGTYVVTMLIDEEASIEAIVAQLEGSGYTTEADSNFGGLRGVVMSNDEMSVTLSWLPDEDSGKFILNYGAVTKKD